MAFIVSRNYRNRASAYKWLIRREDQPIKEARACKRVVCEGVRFQESSSMEYGFGCYIVAVCENAIGVDYEDSPSPVELELSIDTFRYWDDQQHDHVVVDEVKHLDLTPDTEIFATVPQ